MRRMILCLGLALMPAVALAQPAPAPDAAGPAPTAADTANGRFTFTPVDGGVLKLDTRTGMASFCSKGTSGFACLAVPDSRDAYEAEIARLQAQIDGKGGATSSSNKLEVPLPSQSDLDAAYAYAGKLYQRLRGFIDGVENGSR